jgi:two-component system, chemotaxis family, CheB/CheR fusion protein
MLTANIMLDAAGLVTLWNARAQRVFGYAGDDIIGRPAGLLFVQPGAPDEAMLSAAAEVGYVDVSAEGLRNDGGRFPTQALLTSLGDKGSKGYSLVVQNVTEQSQAQQKRRDENG